MRGPAAVLTAVAAVSAVLNWVAVARQRQTVEYVAKPLTMILLAAVAVAIDGADPTRRAWFIAAALFCLAGDVFLMLPRDRFVPGLVAFLVGHICYVAGFLTGGGLSASGGVAGAVLVALAVVVVGRRVLAGVRRTEPALFGPVLAYLAVISTMVVAAFAGGPPLAALGAVLFYASDSVIAWRRFLAPPSWAPVAIMVTYHAAQFALIGSLAVPS